MSYKGDNLMSVKRTNRSAALRALHEKGAMSRKRLAESMHLTPAAITKIVAEMISDGLLSEGEMLTSGNAGRREILIDINAQKACGLGVLIQLQQAILSGGQGDDEEISEAVCMRNYLTAAGVEEDRLILEDRSTSTRENLLFSDQLTGCGSARCGIISNDFHICRVLKLARQAGYRDCYGIPAEGDPVMELHYIVRESVALFMMVLQRS